MSEELLQQLVHMVAENNRLIKDVQQELREFKAEMYEFKTEMYAFRDEMYEFRDDATQRLERLERQDKLIEADIGLMHKKVSDHEREINRIKQVGQ
ncbi:MULTISPECIES: hypothetical protein [Brevibacillus]|jgi:chromosome segregation ATPase|uniref:Uncharacterized protein n=1 Tax=Brevibacillus parabrevis TaxID=54914 RepID=A0A4Y3PGE9_BREPA|nr:MULTISPECIES: hypothetical protein [Brevibacillus]MBU8713084.1 hypothetical protein [Brevibacillus parabrevis]MDH6348607.1 chromosome segregation ATPase [Brevibacillus sp. 1238]MDR5002247.1 hypothetical protein [Brevibacillus parabrevis]MED2256304.1 hypothetical protein [Brevibacillus parabrevis]NRQ53112.1 hypothetical protein [Brevibacillus sp. HD1.4A]